MLKKPQKKRRQRKRKLLRQKLKCEKSSRKKAKPTKPQSGKVRTESSVFRGNHKNNKVVISTTNPFAADDLKSDDDFSRDVSELEDDEPIF